ncbi:MAG: 6,7-dimethyl-8-ribityllumazine synthase [Bacteroidales bacterium]|jgi:6,7-dimethyl-8-ribityllumazine synthase|nr:6,7-dimethyl-8-ribityllumazine synthase [Bacteroidales bacterium]MCK9498390.1 6,7-dimethyl-8-ribityllumazine synthase [Bacteroidales bacterium]MDY0314190.1 6,7-dimethyl-8-ribityllumazine synthase [Bacteroidales bacterium]NLB86362.1 6,7-dimethyl-8-ribityllumazine synthase [Bacteroidales bacterium]
MASSLKNLSQYSEQGVARQNEDDLLSIGIVVSEWNQEVTASMAEAAIETLKKYGFQDEDIILKSVPGSFELPKAAKYFVEYANVDAIICLGCVIQGETRHFDFVCSGLTQGIMQVNLDSNIPVAYGVLTTNNLQQALDRAGGKHGNKGVEATVAALKMLQMKLDFEAENSIKLEELEKLFFEE